MNPATAQPTAEQLTRLTSAPQLEGCHLAGALPLRARTMAHLPTHPAHTVKVSS